MLALWGYIKEWAGKERFLMYNTNHPAQLHTQTATDTPGDPVYSHHFSFMPPSAGSHLCFVFPYPSAHTAPFSPLALMSFNIPDFCMVSVYTCFF